MEMIPSIANYFGITIDELFGYENNREQKIQAILEKADREIRAIGGFLGKGNGDLSECVELLRNATEEFPEEPRILLKLGDALYFLGWQKMGIISSSNEASDYFAEDTDYNSQNMYWKEALQIFEIKISLADDYKYTAPLVSRVSLSAVQIQPVPDFFWQNHMQTVPDVLKDELKKNSKYDECFA